MTTVNPSHSPSPFSTQDRLLVSQEDMKLNRKIVDIWLKYLPLKNIDDLEKAIKEINFEARHIKSKALKDHTDALQTELEGYLKSSNSSTQSIIPSDLEKHNLGLPIWERYLLILNVRSKKSEETSSIKQRLQFLRGMDCFIGRSSDIKGLLEGKPKGSYFITESSEEKFTLYYKDQNDKIKEIIIRANAIDYRIQIGSKQTSGDIGNLDVMLTLKHFVEDPKDLTHPFKVNYSKVRAEIDCFESFWEGQIKSLAKENPDKTVILYNARPEFMRAYSGDQSRRLDGSEDLEKIFGDYRPLLNPKKPVAPPSPFPRLP